MRCISVSKAIWSCHGGKSSGAGDNNTVCTTAAMNDQKIAVRVSAADNADVGIVRIEHKVARLRFAPCNVGAIAVLCGSSAAASGVVAAIRRVVECPIDEPRTV